jgi:hypothetical protein
MSAPIELTDDDVTFLLTILRNATHPLKTQDLIDHLRRRGQAAESASSAQ